MISAFRSGSVASLLTFTACALIGLFASAQGIRNDALAMLSSASPIDSLVAKAKAAGTREGAQDYAEYLIKMLVPTTRTGNAFSSALSRRLAIADFAVREGKLSWVSEGSVAQAFNDLMKQAADTSGGPAGTSGRAIQTDASVVHQLRLRLYNGSPYLSSVDSHSSECLPSEAMLIMQQLFLTDGTAPEPLRPGGVRITQRNFPTADSLVSRYVVSHSRSEIVKLYDNLAHNLGF